MFTLVLNIFKPKIIHIIKLKEMKRTSILIIVIIFTIVSSSALKAQQAGTFTDARDGHVYKTVTIGSQVWMAENLAYKARKGCWVYDNDIKNLAEFGYLYNWRIAKKRCPQGWHLPTSTEYKTLLNNYGNDEQCYEALIAGGVSGFNVALGGYYDSSIETEDDFNDMGGSATFWTKDSEDGGTFVLTFYQGYKSEAAIWGDGANKTIGYYVRCIKD